MVAVVALLSISCSDDSDPSDEGAAVAGQQDTGTTVVESGSKDAVTVGSGDSAESTILGALYAEVLEYADYRVTRRLQFGPRATYLDGLEEGELDVVPEFAGPLAQELGADVEADAELRDVEAAVEESLPSGLVAFEPSDASVGTVLVVTSQVASERSLTDVADVSASGGGLVVGGREDLEVAPPGAQFRPLDGGGPLTKEALSQGTIDVAVLDSTDGSIRSNGWVVLEGDAGLAPPGNALALARDGVLDDEARALVAEVNRAMPDVTFRELVARVTLRQEDPEEVARDWADDAGLLGGG